MKNSENITIQVNTDLMNRIESKCSNSNQSLDEYLTRLINQDLETIEHKNQKNELKLMQMLAITLGIGLIATLLGSILKII